MPDAVPCAACQILSIAPGQVSAAPGDLQRAQVVVRIAASQPATAWQPAIQALQALHARPGLHLERIPPEDAAVLRAGVDLLVFDADAPDAEQLAFELKRALAAARGARPETRLLVAAAPEMTAALRARGLEPYVDAFVPPAAPLTSADLLLESSPRVWRAPEDAVALGRSLATAAALQAWFPEGLAAIRDRALTCGEDRRLPTFLNPATLDLIAISRSCAMPAIVTSDIPGVRAERLDLGTISAFRVAGATGDRFAEGVSVAAARTLTVAEIIARHQAAAARQTSEIRTDIARGSLTLTFEAPGFVAPVTVTSQTTIYRDASRTDLRQSQITVNGAPFPVSGGVPRLPIIEPERVASPPLAIALTDVYDYALAGRDTIAGRPVYVVAFAPRDGTASLYRGRAWIDAQTFGMVRTSAVQTGLKGPITASEQTDEFGLDAAGHWLLARSDTRQTYEGANIRTPIQRLMVIDRHDVNSADFVAERARAYASTDVMLRDTPEGFRYLKPAAGSRQPSAESRQPSAASGTPGAGSGRSLVPAVTHIRTIAFGVLVDPNISRPLPFGGLSYVDFNLFDTGTQFNGFFAGTYGQAAFAVPSLGGTKWQLAGRGFAIASFYNDRAFENGLEQYALDIRQRPASAAVWALRPLTARTAFRVEYDWDYTRFERGDLTSPLFIVPANQNAHAIRVGFDLQHAGWQASVWASAAARIGWHAWGPVTDLTPPRQTYQRAGASLLRAQSWSPRLTTRIEAAAMGGSNLDRFSRYSFGTFDNRLHGYPSALVRYDRGAVLRTALAWTAARAVRIDGFLDTAGVHDPGFGPGFRNYTGFGAAIEAPAPFGSLIAVEWGYGLRGVNTNGDTGTHVVRISGYKVF